MRLHGALCSIPFNLICNMTTFSNKKRPFDPTQGLRMCIMTKFEMQHDYFQKKSFDSTPGAEGVCKDRICACIMFYVQFALIWYAT